MTYFLLRNIDKLLFPEVRTKITSSLPNHFLLKSKQSVRPKK